MFLAFRECWPRLLLGGSSQLLVASMVEGAAEGELGSADAAAGLLHVAVEALGGHLDLLEEGAVEHGRRGPLRPLARRRLRRLRELVVRQARRDLERVPDLSPVPAPRRSRVVLAIVGYVMSASFLWWGGGDGDRSGSLLVLHGKVQDLVVLDHEARLAGHPVPLGLDLAQLADVQAEDVARLVLVERRVVQRHVDARLERLVDGAHAVRGQEE